jgi:hypothetical protein
MQRLASMMALHGDKIRPPQPGWDGRSTAYLIGGVLWQGLALSVLVKAISLASGDRASDFMATSVWSSVPAVLAAFIAGIGGWRAHSGYWQRFAKWFFWLGLPVGFVSCLLTV